MKKLDEMVLRTARLIRRLDDRDTPVGSAGYTPETLLELAVRGTSVTEKDFDQKAVLRRLRREV